MHRSFTYFRDVVFTNYWEKTNLVYFENIKTYANPVEKDIDHIYNIIDSSKTDQGQKTKFLTREVEYLLVDYQIWETQI